MIACGSDDEPADGVPVAIITTVETAGVAPLSIAFSGRDSYDSDGEIVDYRWELPNNEVKSGSVITHTFNTPGSFIINLVVTDNDGLESSDTVDISVVSENARFSIKGTITSTPFTDVDGDINDPLASYFDNNGDTPEDVQVLSNPVDLNGFAAKSATNNSSDVFGDQTDAEDHYQINLNAKDFISLKVIDFADADLDIFLYEKDSLDLVGYSNGSEQFESIQVAESGQYVVVVSAYSGYSKYLLKIGRSSLVMGVSAQGNKTDFVDHQVVVLMDQNEAPEDENDWYSSRAQIKMSHHRRHRAALGHINPLNPQTQTMLWGKAVEEGFNGRLAMVNPSAANKLQTIRAIKKIQKQRGVKYAEPNYRVKGLLNPSDPEYRLQWHHSQLNMPDAWDISTGNPDVIVAVVDSGVYMDHPDIRYQLVDGYDFISDVNAANDGDGIDPDPSDPGNDTTIARSTFHGTHVTGIIVEQLGNNRGGVGVAPNVRVMPLRAIGMDGGFMYDVLQAVRYAAQLENDSNTIPEQAADVINLSLGGEGYAAGTQELFDEVREKGIIVVASSGNQDTGIAMYPASFAGVISVGATDPSGLRASYSNTGPYLDVMAPGGDMTQDSDNDGYQDGILSCRIFENNGAPDPAYGFYDGTSMAAPQVAGIAALMKSVYSELTPDLFDSILYSGEMTTDKGDPGRDNAYGYGSIDGYKALLAAQRLLDGGTTVAAHPSRYSLSFDAANARIELDIQAVGNGSIEITRVLSSESWITVSQLDTSSNGIGTYEVEAQVTTLDNGNYRSYLEFETDQGTTIRVDVLVRIGDVVESGNAGFLYVLLIDANSESLVDSKNIAPINGQYNYSFDDLAVSDYYISAGSDIDNNGLICEEGESCGLYPSADNVEVFYLIEDMNGLDFEAGL